jgi:hypothetical protein
MKNWMAIVVKLADGGETYSDFVVSKAERKQSFTRLKEEE